MQQADAQRSLAEKGVVLRVPDSDDSVGQQAARNQLLLGSEGSLAALSPPPHPPVPIAIAASAEQAVPSRRGGAAAGTPELLPGAAAAAACALALPEALVRKAVDTAAAQAGTTAAEQGLAGNAAGTRAPAVLQSGRGEELDEFLQPTQLGALPPRPAIGPRGATAPAPQAHCMPKRAQRAADLPDAETAMPAGSEPASLQPTAVQSQSDVDDAGADDVTSAPAADAPQKNDFVDAGDVRIRKCTTRVEQVDAKAQEAAAAKVNTSSVPATQVYASLVVPDSVNGSHGCSASLHFSDGSWAGSALEDLPATQVLTASKPDDGVDEQAAAAPDDPSAAPAVAANMAAHKSVTADQRAIAPQLQLDACAAAIPAGGLDSLPASQAPLSQVTVRESASPPDSRATRAAAPEGAAPVAFAAWVERSERGDCFGTVIESQLDSETPSRAATSPIAAPSSQPGSGGARATRTACDLLAAAPPAASLPVIKDAAAPAAQASERNGTHGDAVRDTEESAPATQLRGADEVHGGVPSATTGRVPKETAEGDAGAAVRLPPGSEVSAPRVVEDEAPAEGAACAAQPAGSDGPGCTVRDSDSDCEGVVGAADAQAAQHAKQKRRASAAQAPRKVDAPAPHKRAASAWTVAETVSQGVKKVGKVDASQRVRTNCLVQTMMVSDGSSHASTVQC